MDMIHRGKSLKIACIGLSILSFIRCGSIENVNIDVTTPCQDVAEAINRVYGSLPDQMPLEARCKRYAVFLSMEDTAGVTNELALLQLSLMKGELLDVLYEEISTVDLAARYIAAINVYRETRLQPAFIDLIECLRDIHTVVAKAYLDNPELKTVEELYRRVLASPADEIDLESVDLRGFHPGFRASLQKLLEGHSDRPGLNSGQIDLFNQLSSSYLPRKLLAEQFIRDTEERVRFKLRQRRLARVREIDRNRYWKKKELLRQQLPSIGQERPQWPKTIQDPRTTILEGQRNLERERREQYQEQDLEERGRRRRQLLVQQKNLMMQAHAVEVPPDPSASTPRAAIFESSLGQRIVEVQGAEQPADKLERLRSRRREWAKWKRVRDPQVVREQERKRKLHRQQRLREQRQDPPPDESIAPSDSGQEDHQQ